MYQQKGDSAKGGNKFWEGILDVPFNPRSCFLPVGWGSRPWEMGFCPRTEITSLFASLMGRLTAFLPQITKPVGPVMATGVLTVARFVGKVGCYLLVASLSGRLRASLSGRLTAFHPPDHKAGGSRHRDGGAHGGEICWESRMLPLGCESLGTPQGVPLGMPDGVPPSRSQSRWVSSLRGGAHGGEICWESRMLPLGCESLGTPHGVPPPRSQSRRVPSSRRGCSRWRDLLGNSEVTSWSRVSRDASGRPSRDASRRSTPQITKPVGPVIATGVLTVARFVPRGNWMTHLLANSPVGGCWARRPCHSLVGPPGATWVTPAKWWSREAPLVTRLWPWTQSMAISLASALLMSL